MSNICETLAQNPNISDYAVVESALVISSRLTSLLVVPIYQLSYGPVKSRNFAQAQAKSMLLPENLFEQYYRDSKRISKTTLIITAKSNTAYNIKSRLSKANVRALVVASAQEIRSVKQSAQLYQALYQALMAVDTSFLIL
ncbi:MAG: hypothetical protein LBN40_03030 [Oscillospiraceae bacterium]|nr:hypothetical protein [Oscillospiraceae bacterium]